MMKSCRDCVHYKPCQEWAIDCYHGNTMFPYEAETGEEICEHYTPIADVVPKSEVDWKSIPVDVSEALKQRTVEKAKAEVAREIFEEIETCLYRPFDNIPDDVHYQIREQDYEELKKKYIKR